MALLPHTSISATGPTRVSDYERDENPILLGSRKCTTGSIRATGFSSNAQPQRPATPHAKRQIGSQIITQHQYRSLEALNPTTLLSQSNIVLALPHQTNPTVFLSTQTSMIISNNYRNGNSISSRISSSTTERSPQCPTFTISCHQTNHFMPYQTVQWHTTQRALDGCSGRRTDND